MTEQRECRYCHTAIPVGRLACAKHWRMLPEDLRTEILMAHQRHDRATYVEGLKQADALMQSIFDRGESSGEAVNSQG